MSYLIISKRHTRAGSEIQSPLPATRTRRTRASSVDPESLSDQSKSLPTTPIKTRRRASVVPSSSPVKEQIELEDHMPYVRLIDSTIVETEEITNSGNFSKLFSTIEQFFVFKTVIALIYLNT